MAEREMKAGGKTVQKMTRDGLVEMDLAEKTTKRVSERGEEIRLTRNRSPDLCQANVEKETADFEKNPFKMDSGSGEAINGRGDRGNVLSEHRGEANRQSSK